MLIDAHQHLWRLDAPWHEWPLSDSPTIYRDYELGDLRSVRDSTGIAASILVQSQPSDQDTDWLLAVAKGDETIAGVVGWADLKASDAVDRISRLAEDPKLIGLRPMLQSLPDDWILDPGVEPGIEAMVRLGLRFDALVRPSQLHAVAALVQRRPDLPVILDHCAKPALSGDGFEGWAADMRRLAAHPQVYCKFSGLLTEGAPAEARGVDRILDLVFELFGAGRIVWGSDWPVVEMRTSYAGWLDICHELVARKAPGRAAEIFGGNARRFYGLDSAGGRSWECCQVNHRRPQLAQPS